MVTQAAWQTPPAARPNMRKSPAPRGVNRSKGRLAFAGRLLQAGLDASLAQPARRRAIVAPDEWSPSSAKAEGNRTRLTRSHSLKTPTAAPTRGRRRSFTCVAWPIWAHGAALVIQREPQRPKDLVVNGRVDCYPITGCFGAVEFSLLSSCLTSRSRHSHAHMISPAGEVRAEFFHNRIAGFAEGCA